MRDRNQVVLPINLEICIENAENVFLLHEICEELDYSKLDEAYIRHWRKLDPKTMFEIIVYAYMNGIYSARQIVSACKNDIRYMCLLNGEMAPSHATISRFQDGYLSGVIEDLFYQLIKKLQDMGEVRFRNIFVDGTKIEANANRYTFVWKKAVEKLLDRLNAKLEARSRIISERYGFKNEVRALECYEALVRHSEWLRLTFVHGAGKRKTQLQKDIEELGQYLQRKEEYQKQLGQMPGRNSYSKTDVDATFMRTKDDHMKNGQLKPCYNIQLGVESEYIVGVGSFTNPTDVQTLIPFLNRVYSYTNRRFEQVIADAGYESIENYLYLEEHRQKCFIKPQNYEKSRTRKYKSNKYIVENLPYDPEKDEFTCMRGDKLTLHGTGRKVTANGYETDMKYYRNCSCEGCEHFGKCHSSKNGYRTIKVTKDFSEYRREALKNITEDEGRLLCQNRSIQVKGAFGVLKQDFGFRRFMTRGKKDIETQMFILAFAFNIKKLHNRKNSGRFGTDLFVTNAS